MAKKLGYPDISVFDYRRNSVMQTIFVIGVAALMAIANPCAAAQAGSADAAKELVPEYLGRLYTTVEMPVVTGDKATVKARMLNLNCTLELVKHATSNASGWVVEKVNCKKP